MWTNIGHAVSTQFTFNGLYGFHILFLFVTNTVHNNEVASGSLSVRIYIVQ